MFFFFRKKCRLVVGGGRPHAVIVVSGWCCSATPKAAEMCPDPFEKSAALFHLQLLLLLVLCCSPGPPWYLHLKIDRNGVQHVINSITALLEILHFSRFFFKSNYFDLINLNICENSGKNTKNREKYVNYVTLFSLILLIFSEF